MIPLDYQNPQHVTSPRKIPRWQPYFGGAACALLSGFIIWFILLGIWPNGRWEILDPPDMFACDAIGALIFLAISAAIYIPFASPRQAANRHFMHGIIAGLSLMSITNFLQRADNAELASQAVLGAIYSGSFLITPVLLGGLSRYYAKKL